MMTLRIPEERGYSSLFASKQGKQSILKKTEMGAVFISTILCFFCFIILKLQIEGIKENLKDLFFMGFIVVMGIITIGVYITLDNLPKNRKVKKEIKELQSELGEIEDEAIENFFKENLKEGELSSDFVKFQKENKYYLFRFEDQKQEKVVFG